MQSEEKHIQVVKTARYHVWGNAGPSTQRIWFVVHGYGQLAAYFIKNFSFLNPHTDMVIAPEGLSRFYLNGITPDSRVGATWMTKEDREHEISDYVSYFDSLLEQYTASFEQECKVNVVGFSQGCSTVSRWVAYGRVKPQKLILWAGTFPNDIDLQVHGSAFKQLDFHIVYGNKDEYLGWINADEIIKWLQAAGIEPTITVYDGGHEIVPHVAKELLV